MLEVFNQPRENRVVENLVASDHENASVVVDIGQRTQAASRGITGTECLRLICKHDVAKFLPRRLDNLPRKFTNNDNISGDSEPIVRVESPVNCRDPRDLEADLVDHVVSHAPTFSGRHDDRINRCSLSHSR